MPTYRVGVRLDANMRGFGRAFRRAAGESKRLAGGLKRAGAAGTEAGRDVARAAERGASAFRRAAGPAAEFRRGLRGAGRAAGRMGRATAMAGRRAGRAVGDLTRRVAGLARQWRQVRREAGRATAGGGGGIGRGARNLLGLAAGGMGAATLARGEMDMERRMTMLRLDAGVGRAEAAQWRAQIEAAAQDPEIRAALSEVVAAVEAHGRLTGRYQDAVDQAAVMARLITRSGASGTNVGRLVGDMGLFGFTGEDAVERAAAALVQAQKKGAVGVAEISGQSSRLMANWRALPGEAGRDGEASYRDMLAAVQATYRVTGTEDTAVTALEATTAALMDSRKLQQMREAGIRAPDTRPAMDVFRDLAALPMERASEILDREAMKTLRAFSVPAAVGTMNDVYAALADLDGARQEYVGEVSEAAGTTAARVRALTDRASIAFGGVSRWTGLDAVAGTAMQHAPELLTAGAGIWGLSKLWRGGRGLLERVRGRRGGDVFRGAARLPGRAAEHAADVAGARTIRRMIVGVLTARSFVGGPGGMSPGGRRRPGRRGVRGAASGGRGLLARAAAGGRGLLSRVRGAAGRLAPAAARRLPWIGAALAGGAAALHAARGEWAQAGREGATAGGALAAGAAGAAIGTAILPGVGTVIGGLLAAAAGGAGADALFRRFAGPRALNAPVVPGESLTRTTSGAPVTVPTGVIWDPGRAVQPGAERAAAAALTARPNESIHVTISAPIRVSVAADLDPRAPEVGEQIGERLREALEALPENIREAIRDELKRRDQEREDRLNALTVDHNRLVTRY